MLYGKYYLFAHSRKYMYSVYCKYMCSQLGHYYFCIKGFLQMANSINCGQMVKKRPISTIEIAKIAKKAAKSVKAANVSKLFTLDIHGKLYF